MEFILDLEEVLLVILSDEVYGQSKMTESTRSTDSVKVCLRIPRVIEVDYHIHRHDVDTTSEEISAH